MVAIPKKIQEWITFNEKNQKFWSILFLNAISLSFILSDWMWGVFTFSEYILGVVFLLLAAIGQYRITKKQFKWILMVLGFLIFHIAIQEITNEQFYFKTGIAAFIKLSFYILLVTGLYNYILNRRLEKQFLINNNIFAAIACLIGLYITIAVYTNGLLPFNFFWEFTRSDITSYIFNNGNIAFVRTRSVFSEPSYFGFYLNTILAMNYLNSSNIKIHWMFSVIISVTILLTVSYSAIFIMLFTTILYFFTSKKELLKRNWRKGIFLAMIFAIIIMLVYTQFQDFFNQAFIQRTINIFTDTSNSGYSRLFGSWEYVNKENILLGNGLGHTPSIWNIYAYMLSDLGVFGLIIFIIVTIIVVRLNRNLAISFVLMNFSKGGYLSSAFWLFLLLTFIYTSKKRLNQV